LALPASQRRLAVPLLALLIALTLSPTASQGNAAAVPRCGPIRQAPRAATLHQLRTSILCLVNRARGRHGMAPLHFDRALRRSASGLSMAMVRSGSFSHYGPHGSTLSSRVARSGYLARASSYRLAENIGAGRGRTSGSPLATVRHWLHSPGHRRNILDRRLRDFGAGVARGYPLGRSANAATYTLDLGARHR
jgi:uncharacterized protein YkwD